MKPQKSDALWAQLHWLTVLGAAGWLHRCGPAPRRQQGGDEPAPTRRAGVPLTEAGSDWSTFVHTAL